MTHLPITWQNLFDWCASRMTPLQSYHHADELWKQIAPLLLDELRDQEVEELNRHLIAEHGAFEVRKGGPIRPNTTEQDIPYGVLNKRLTLIEKRRAWLVLHQGKSHCDIVSSERMIALSIHTPPPMQEFPWLWEVIQEDGVEHFGSAKSEEEAWKQAREYWQTARHRLLNPTAKQVQSS